MSVKSGEHMEIHVQGGMGALHPFPPPCPSAVPQLCPL